MSLNTPVKNFHHQDDFFIEIDGFKVASFMECSELSVEIGKVETWEGGSKVPNKSPGKVKFADITFKRGRTLDEDFYTWCALTAQFTAAGLGTSKVGLADGAYKRNFDIVQVDRDGSELHRWSVAKAWPVKFVAGKWDGKAEEVVTEELTVTFDNYDVSV